MKIMSESSSGVLGCDVAGEIRLVAGSIVTLLALIRAQSFVLVHVRIKAAPNVVGIRAFGAFERSLLDVGHLVVTQARLGVAVKGAQVASAKRDQLQVCEPRHQNVCT